MKLLAPDNKIYQRAVTYVCKIGPNTKVTDRFQIIRAMRWASWSSTIRDLSEHFEQNGRQLDHALDWIERQSFAKLSYSLNGCEELEQVVLAIGLIQKAVYKYQFAEAAEEGSTAIFDSCRSFTAIEKLLDDTLATVLSLMPPFKEGRSMRNQTRIFMMEQDMENPDDVFREEFVQGRADRMDINDKDNINNF